MRLGICNFIFPGLDEARRAAVLQRVEVVDFAPTAHGFQWADTPPVGADGLWQPPRPLSCLQSIYYGVQGASLVQDEQAFATLESHTHRVCNWARALGAGGLVYGAPGTRTKTTASADQVEQRLLALHGVAAAAGLHFYLEAASPRFGTEFASSTRALLALRERLPALALHLDVGQMLEEGLDVPALVGSLTPALGHLHLSSSSLTMPTVAELAIWHEVLDMLKSTGSGIDAVVEIQKLRPEEFDPLLSLLDGLRAHLPSTSAGAIV